MGNTYLNTGLQTLDLVQGLIDDDKADRSATQDSSGNSIASGRLIEDVTLPDATFTNIEHKLGRAWKGYVVVGKTADFGVYNGTASDQSVHLRLRQDSGSEQTVSLWVF